MEQAFTTAIQVYIAHLQQIEQCCTTHTVLDPTLYAQLHTATDDVLSVCAEFEKTHTAQEITTAQAWFQRQTHSWFSQSNFAHRARIWPRGYAGDFEMLEAIYQGVPIPNKGFGLYLDSYFLSRRIVAAARGRLAKLIDLLATELQIRRAGCTILNVACGSCRELFALPSELALVQPHVVCLDADPAALDFAKNLLTCNGINLENFQFIQYNALRLVNYERSLGYLGQHDIIYSTGLLDYIADEPLVLILATLWKLLKPKGKLVAPFKDERCYNVLQCHWLVNWSAFLQRTEADIDDLFEQAGIPTHCIVKSRERTGTMIFYMVTRY
jgi:SAM-dependent methyltransferase